MSSINLQYPPSPTEIPANLTKLPGSYQWRVMLAILSIVLFFALYVLMIIAFGYLIKLAVLYPMNGFGTFSLILKFGSVAGTVMLFLFTLKFILNLNSPPPTNRIKLNENEYPQLWKFVYQICEETKASKPRSIYADPDVNAYVSYSNRWKSLFLPTGKDLTIGLGLVSCLDMTEFKAVVAHEFGHFAQSSMKIGSYISSANTIIYNMIFTRDRWDELLDKWKTADLRLSIAAWVISPIIWIVRQLLRMFYQFLNIMHSSLSREMEFNADKVAVSVTGSQGIVSALWKLESLSGYWNATLNHAYNAALKDKFPENLYPHNEEAIDRSSDIQNQALLSMPIDEKGIKTYFNTSEVSKVNMYASHPPNNQREKSAKTPFVACEHDPSSPWQLFGINTQLQRDMTSLVVQQYFDKTPSNTMSFSEFENYILAEEKDVGLLNEYYDTFRERFLEIPSEEELAEYSSNMDLSSISIDKIKSDLQLLIEPIKKIEAQLAICQSIAQGTSSQKSFGWNDKIYSKKNLEEGYFELVGEKQKLLEESFKEWDKGFCGYHMALASNEQRIKLTAIYDQHQLITRFYRTLSKANADIQNKVNELHELGEVEQVHVSSLAVKINNIIRVLNDHFMEMMKKLEDQFVPLPNISNIDELRMSITSSGNFESAKGRMFENGGYEKNMNMIASGINHLQRIDQKGIGVILAYHKEIQNETSGLTSEN